MEKIIVLVMSPAITCWAVPKPMESLRNYNVLLLHGAYGSNKGFLNVTDADRIDEAYKAAKPLDNGANIGRYVENSDEDNPRLTKWLCTNIFEEPIYESAQIGAHKSYVYQWRSFSNPANSSIANAVELGDRTWSLPGTIFSKRRALVEEAQEVKASLKVSKNGKDSLYVGQAALDTIRRNSDLYRQLASRYILIGHSMGGVASHEYVTDISVYNDDVDKVITLDSPHEGTGR